MHKQFKLITFDIDETLTPEISWLGLTRSLGASVEKHLAIYEALKREKLSLRAAEQQLLAIWRQTGNANKKFMQTLFDKWHIHPEAFEVMKYLKEENYLICIISGGVDLYVETIASRLGVKNHFSNTELVWDDVGMLIDFHYAPDQAIKKLEQFKQFISERNILPEQCVSVGDSMNDYKLFSYTKHGVLVRTPDVEEELSKYAWKEIDNVSEVKKIV